MKDYSGISAYCLGMIISIFAGFTGGLFWMLIILGVIVVFIVKNDSNKKEFLYLQNTLILSLLLLYFTKIIDVSIFYIVLANIGLFVIPIAIGTAFFLYLESFSWVEKYKK